MVASSSSRDAALLIGCATVLLFAHAGVGREHSFGNRRAQGENIDAHMAQQTFPGLKYCIS